jgi:hypothetical protein
MERMQDTFEKDPREGLPEFNKFVMYLKSSINDKSRIQKIEKEMAAERQRISSSEYCEMFPYQDETQKEFMVGFKIVNGCMKYVISAFNISHVGKDMSGESGLLLEHYLSTMEKMQKTFAKNDTYSFNLFIYYIRAVITDDEVIKAIDNDMIQIRKSFGVRDLDHQQECEIGFRVINWCMRFLDKTMKINKKQVRVLADQTDPRMPAPVKKLEEEP